MAVARENARGPELGEDAVRRAATNKKNAIFASIRDGERCLGMNITKIRDGNQAGAPRVLLVVTVGFYEAGLMENV